MRLSFAGLQDRAAWEEKGYHLPEYQVEEMISRTKKNPFWIHFGAGNLFRAYHARVAEELLNQGIFDRGLVVSEGFDGEIVDKLYIPYDNLWITATLKSDGSVEKTVVASVAEALPLDPQNQAAFGRLTEIFQQDSLQMATFTITEKGYSLTDASGEFLPDVKADLEKGPKAPNSYMGKVASLLYARYQAGEKPIAMVSTDNCSHNGDRLYEALAVFARAWEEQGAAREGFLAYLDSRRVSFPWTMIDKITPRPDASVQERLKADGVEALEPVITSRNTYAAPFVNAEETEYLVIEDDFPGGRPDLEKGGFLFTSRDTVEKVEKMKVCTCLNPLHTCLAVFGCLLGYERISEEIRDPDLRRLVEIVGYREGLPVAADPKILDPKAFLDQVLNVRIPNPFLPDSPKRIATDTSQKLAIRFGETIKAYEKRGESADLLGIPLVLAGWVRYLMGVDDQGKAFAVSPDPLLAELLPMVEQLSLGNPKVCAVRPIFQNERIFGVDLYRAGLGRRTETYLEEMLKGPGAVRACIKKYTVSE